MYRAHPTDVCCMAGTVRRNRIVRIAGVHVGASAAVIVWVMLSAAVAAPAQAEDPKADESLRIHVARSTGVARFVTSTDREGLGKAAAPGSRGKEPVDFFRRHGYLFGIADVATQLLLETQTTDSFGFTRTTFQQIHEGTPVFGALLRVHADPAGRITAANGTFVPDIAVSTNPSLSAGRVEVIAVSTVAKLHAGCRDLKAEEANLYIYRRNLARGVPGTNHLAYEVEVRGEGVREFVYVDAHKGTVIDQVSGIHESINRRVYEGGFGDEYLVWSEGDSLPYGFADIDNLIEYAEDTYNLFASATNGSFLSWDGADGIMYHVYDVPGASCPNAFWNGYLTGYCPGVTSDDTVAHEWGHAYTQSTHNLVYQWQPGALNEAYSDIFGEVVDLLNGSGLDLPDDLRLDDECSAFGVQPPTLRIHSPGGIAGTYAVAGARFNPAPPVLVTADLEAADDGDDEGGAGNTTDGCQALIGFTPGRIALVDRGVCEDSIKAVNAQAAGAVGAIVVNTEGDTVFSMPGSDPTIVIPSVMLGQTDGAILRGALPGVNATIALESPADPSLRWLQGEDDAGFSGAIRDMWNPNCFGDPGKVSDVPEYWCGTGDSGGVHINSGIPNHVFALLTDGGDYNGQSIDGIGLTKAFHIFWRAASTYQVPASDFADHADALEQSCADLVGFNLFVPSPSTPMGSLSGEVITASDCTELSKVIAAVELRLEPTQCAFAPMLNPEAPPWCNVAGTLRRVYVQDWESGLGSWSVGTRDVWFPDTFDTPDWAVVGDLPDQRPGSAAFVADLVIGDCGADFEAGVLYLQSPVIHLPSGVPAPHVAFDHWAALEEGWDGGNVKISVNGGAWTLVPPERFEFNPYPGQLYPPDENYNPMAGEPAFTGANGGEITGGWGQSQIELASLVVPGDDVRLRFEMGLDGCNGWQGWYVDAVQVHYCCDRYGDVACDARLDLDDYAAFSACFHGPGQDPPFAASLAPTTCLDLFDADADADIDLADFVTFQQQFDGP